MEGERLGTGELESFMYLSNGFVPHNVDLAIPAASLAFCSAPCAGIEFNLVNSPTVDDLLFDVGGGGPFYNFPNGAFDAPGVYTTVSGGGAGTLRVTELPFSGPFTFYALEGARVGGGTQQSFVYVHPGGFVPHDVDFAVPVASLASCSPPCAGIEFSPVTSPTLDSLVFDEGSGGPVYSFQNGAFDAPGIYNTVSGGGAGALVVGQVVPEPATLGSIFLALGAVLVRTRKRAASRS